MKTVLHNHLLKINTDFTVKNSKTLQILQSCDSSYSAQDFYYFTMRQDYKNLGFSIRILREKVLEKNPINTKDNPTEKSRANKVLDFIIWQKLEGNREQYQEALRATTTEDEKDALYSDWANDLKLGKEIEKIQQAIYDIMAGTYADQAELLKLAAKWNKGKVTEKPLKQLNVNDFSKFSIYVYYLCRCLGGHEINDLLTGLIHKFENISSFKNIWESLGNPPLDFKDDFALFGQNKKDNSKKLKEDNCEQLADELRLLNGFVRMSNINKNKPLNSKTDPTFGREHWWHLAQVLGTTKTKEEVETQVKDNHPLRNFISNNALKSRRFQYLVKYANVESIYKFAKQNIFEFVLSHIPKAQMERYYKDFDGNYANVAEELLEINLETFSDLNGDNNENYKRKLRLYFTTLYLIVKNLVNINSRYVMALWRLDFDKELCCPKKICHQESDCTSSKKRKCSNKVCDDKICVMQEYIENLVNADSKYAKEQKLNITLFCSDMFTKYRNTIAHQKTVQFRTMNHKLFDFTGKETLKASTKKADKQSYFALYHYMVQRCIIKDFQYNDYSKNLLKILNTPFAYNHGRYNALSIERLFDKNKTYGDDESD